MRAGKLCQEDRETGEEETAASGNRGCSLHAAAGCLPTAAGFGCSLSAEGYEPPVVIPSGAPKARRRGIAVVPAERPSTGRSAIPHLPADAGTRAPAALR